MPSEVVGSVSWCLLFVEEAEVLVVGEVVFYFVVFDLVVVLVFVDVVVSVATVVSVDVVVSSSLGASAGPLQPSTTSNAIESQVIPKTNNAVELVIRRFDQHYQSFCGFEHLSTAQTFLVVFEKIYRTTPFSADAQPRICGKSPLELAGYDLSKIPRDPLLVDMSNNAPDEIVQR